MEPLFLILGAVLVFAVLGILAATFGVDSRDSLERSTANPQMPTARGIH